MDLNLLCKEVCELAKAAGAFIRNEAGKVKNEQVSVKWHNNLVSYVDTTAEQMLVEGLQKLLPDSGFIAEENTIKQNLNAEYCWIIDPLDGTTNFLYGIPSYAVSIALHHRDEGMLLGVVYEVNGSECFHAVKNEGAFLNEKPISVTSTHLLKNAFLSTGFPYYDFEVINEYIKVLRYLMQNTRGIRRLGAAAVDLCYVACGRYDGFFEHSLAPWDVAAGSLIIQEAGGIVSDFGGGGTYLFGKQIVAGNRQIHPAMLQLFKSRLPKIV